MACSGVILGAFAAHLLGEQLTPAQQKTFQTGIEYHFIHSLAICILALSNEYLQAKWIRWVFYFFLIGVLLFSGSLYLLACKNLLNVESWKWLGPITPIGGLSFIIGWVLFAIGVSKNK